MAYVRNMPYPIRVTIGIGFAISVVIAMVLSVVDGNGSSVFSIHEAVGVKSPAGGTSDLK